MDLGIAGKVAIVTGGSHGIGRAISEELGRNGCKVVVAARGQEQMDDTVEAIESVGGKAASVSVDLLDFDSYPRMIEAAKSAFGVPEIGIYSPVGPPPGAFGDFTDEDFDKSFAAVVKGFANFARAIVPGMKEKQWGRLITISSGISKQPARRSILHFDYALANVNRPAALGLNRTLADELGPHGITVNSIPPGFIETGENYRAFLEECARRDGLTYEEFMEKERLRIPLQRFGKPEELSGLCAFLCSKQAGYITGQCIVVDGGLIDMYF